jgi:protein subunit release factor B
VKCQETRSREKNRQIARRLLAEKVDAHLNGPESRLLQRWDRERKKKEAKKRKGARRRSNRVTDEEGTVSDEADGEPFDLPRKAD